MHSEEVGHYEAIVQNHEKWESYTFYDQYLYVLTKKYSQKRNLMFKRIIYEP